MGIRAFTRVGAGGYYDRYEREARAEVAGHAAAYDDEKDQCADTREENCGVGIKTHDNGSKNSCSKHGEHMLQAKENGLSPGKPLIWRDDASRFGGPARKISLFLNSCHTDLLDNDENDRQNEWSMGNQ